jgi:hypothetical protein
MILTSDTGAGIGTGETRVRSPVGNLSELKSLDDDLRAAMNALNSIAAITISDCTISGMTYGSSVIG